MKTFAKIALAAAVSIAAMGANAAVNYGAGVGQPYIGAKVGQFKVDGAEKDPMAYGVYGGYEFGNGFGAELEYVGSDKEKLAGAIDYKVKTYGAYGTYKYNFANTPFYAKGKLGVAKVEVEASANTVAGSVSGKADDTGFAYGLGVGYSPAKNFAIEAEFAKPTSDDDLLTIGAALKF